MDIIRGRWFGRPETEQAAPPSEPPAVTHDASPKVEPFTMALVQSQAAEEPESVVASGEAVEAPSSGVPVKDAPGCLCKNMQTHRLTIRCSFVGQRRQRGHTNAN